MQSVSERRLYPNVGMDHGCRLHRVNPTCWTHGPNAPSIHKGVDVGCGNSWTYRPNGPLFAGQFRRQGTLCLKESWVSLQEKPSELAADEGKDSPYDSGGPLLLDVNKPTQSLHRRGVPGRAVP